MKTWLIETHHNESSDIYGVMTCEEKFVKRFCETLSCSPEDTSPYSFTLSYKEVDVIQPVKTKFYYGDVLKVNGEVYINYKDKWWNENIVLRYEELPGNTSVDEVLEDMELDTDYNESVKYTKFKDTCLVDFI